MGVTCASSWSHAKRSQIVLSGIPYEGTAFDLENLAMNNPAEPSASDVDPMVQNMITSIRDRFGPEGLRDVIRLANQELARAEEAEQHLASLNRQGQASVPSSDPADTQAWLAFTEAEPSDDDVR